MLYHPDELELMSNITTCEDNEIEICSALNSENYLLTITKDLIEFSIVLSPADIVDLAHAFSDIAEELQ